MIAKDKLKELHAIGKLLRTQNNRCTASPMFIVQQRRSYQCEADEGDVVEWRNADWEKADDEEAARLEELHDERDYSDEAVDALKGWTRMGLKFYWEFCMAAFTEEGCKEYLRQNGHNLREPRIYAESWNRCPEMLLVRETLMELSKFAETEVPA